jgi:hypothetical protein
VQLLQLRRRLRTAAQRGLHCLRKKALCVSGSRLGAACVQLKLVRTQLMSSCFGRTARTWHQWTLAASSASCAGCASAQPGLLAAEA